MAVELIPVELDISEALNDIETLKERIEGAFEVHGASDDPRIEKILQQMRNAYSTLNELQERMENMHFNPNITEDLNNVQLSVQSVRQEIEANNNALQQLSEIMQSAQWNHNINTDIEDTRLEIDGVKQNITELVTSIDSMREQFKSIKVEPVDPETREELKNLWDEYEKGKQIVKELTPIMKEASVTLANEFAMDVDALKNTSDVISGVGSKLEQIKALAEKNDGSEASLAAQQYIKYDEVLSDTRDKVNDLYWDYVNLSKEIRQQDNAQAQKDAIAEGIRSAREEVREYMGVLEELHQTEREQVMQAQDQEIIVGHYNNRIQAAQDLDTELQNLTQHETELNEQASQQNSLSEEYQKATEAVGMLEHRLEGSSEEVSRFSQASAGLKSVFESVVSIVKKLGSVLKTVFNQLLSILKTVVGYIKNIGSSLSSTFHNISSKFSDIHKSVSKSTDSFGRMTKKVIALTLGVRSLWALLRKVRRSIIENFQYAISGVDTIQSAFDGLKDQLATIKVQFASAFLPLIEIALPAIQQVVAALAEAANLVSQFIAALTGASTWRKANVTVTDKSDVSSAQAAKKQEEAEEKLAEKNAKALEAYNKKIEKAYEKAGAKQQSVDEKNAKSLEKYEKELKKAEKAVKGYLSPIDEINQYSATEATEIEPPELEEFDYDEYLQDLLDDIGEFEPELMDALDDLGASAGVAVSYTNEEISDKVKDWLEELKKMWETGDFTELGKKLGEKLLKALKSIPWNKIKATANKIGKSLATLINGIVEVPDLGRTIGNTIAQGINTVFELLNGFVHNLKWKSIGKFIADLFNGLFKGIDWKLIYDTVITGMKGLADALWKFIKEFKWDNLSTFISNAVNTAADGIIAFFSKKERNEETGAMETWAARLGRELGAQLRKAINEIEWEDVGRALGSILKAAIDFAANFISQLNWEEIRKAIHDLVYGFLSELEVDDNTINTIMAWIDNLTAWFGKLFEWIASIDWASLFVAIIDTIDKFFAWMDETWTALQPILSEIWDILKPWVDKFIEWIKDIPNKLEDLKKNETFQNIVQKLKELTAQDIIDGLEKFGKALGVIVGLKIAGDLITTLSALFGLFGIGGAAAGAGVGSTLGLTAAGLFAVAAGFTKLKDSILEGSADEIKDRYEGMLGWIQLVRDEWDSLLNYMDTGVWAPGKRFEDDSMGYVKAKERLEEYADKIIQVNEDGKSIEIGKFEFFDTGDYFTSFDIDESTFTQLQEDLKLTDEEVVKLKQDFIDSVENSSNYQGSLREIADAIGYIPEKYEDVTKASLTYTDAQGNATAEYNRYGELITRISSDNSKAVENEAKSHEKAFTSTTALYQRAAKIAQESGRDIEDVFRELESAELKKSQNIKQGEETVQKASQDTVNILKNGHVTLQTSSDSLTSKTEANNTRVTTSERAKTGEIKLLTEEQKKQYEESSNEHTKTVDIIIEENHELEESNASMTEEVVKQWETCEKGVTENSEKMSKATTDANDEMKKSTEDTTKAMGTSWEGVANKIKGAINSILGFVERMVNGIIDAYNKMADKLGNLSIDIPDWVPEIGGNNFELSLPKIDHISIPRLAKGAVLPPNQEFMAVLGDQKRGTNIETPLSTMVDAFNQALAQNGGGGGQPITLNLMLPDKRTVAQYVIEGGQILQMSRGRNPFYLERG